MSLNCALQVSAYNWILCQSSFCPDFFLICFGFVPDLEEIWEVLDSLSQQKFWFLNPVSSVVLFIIIES